MRLFGLITLSLIAMAVIAITSLLWQNMKEPVVAKTNDGMGEGINVHGDWEVKVSDPNTGAEEVYAFSNEFMKEQGSNVLALTILGEAEGLAGVVHKYNPDHWKVAALSAYTEAGATNVSLCIGPKQADIEIAGGSGGVETLGRSWAPKLRYTDDCISEVDGSLIRVFTVYDDPAHSITSDGLDTIFGFTTHLLAEPIEVKKGQTISFDVLISFD